MNQGKYIFAQLTDFLPRRVFDSIVNKHEGNKYVRSFTCWNQMLSLEAHQSKYYHLGFGSTIKTIKT